MWSAYNNGPSQGWSACPAETAAQGFNEEEIVEEEKEGERAARRLETQQLWRTGGRKAGPSAWGSSVSMADGAPVIPLPSKPALAPQDRPKFQEEKEELHPDAWTIGGPD